MALPIPRLLAVTRAIFPSIMGDLLCYNLKKTGTQYQIPILEVRNASQQEMN
jgi:hypothetical protein